MFPKVRHILTWLLLDKYPNKIKKRQKIIDLIDVPLEINETSLETTHYIWINIITCC